MTPNLLTVPSTRSGPKPPLTGAALRKAIMAIWCVCFCGMQWRAIGQLCDIPFGTLYSLFARWTRVAPTTQPPDSDLAAGLRRYCRPQRRHHRQPILSVGTDLLRPRLRWRQEDQGHQDPSRRGHPEGSEANYGFALAITVSPANVHDSKGIVPVLHQLAGFKGTALGDLSYRGQRLSKRRSASPSNPAPVAMAEPSFRKVFAGWSSVPWHGLVATGG